MVKIVKLKSFDDFMQYRNEMIDLINQQFREENKHNEIHENHYDISIEHYKDYFTSNSLYFVLLALEENNNCDSNNSCIKPLGFSSVIQIPKLNKKLGYLYVDELFVSANHRKQGIGSILLTEIKQQVNDENLQVAGVRLLVRKENEIAQSAYQKNDFQLSETLFGQYLKK
ncbi:hypothetical protein ABK040_008949 [Willaertia magna]